VERWKKVCLISTTHDDKMVSDGVRGKDIIKPKAVVDYNSQMGVDLSDTQLVSYHKNY
jgi:hypothetical protein